MYKENVKNYRDYKYEKIVTDSADPVGSSNTFIQLGERAGGCCWEIFEKAGQFLRAMPENNANPRAANGSSNLEIAQSNQDLIISKGRTKKRKWIITGVIVAIAVGLVIAAIILLTKGGEKNNPEQPVAESLTFEDYLSGKFGPKYFNASWAADSDLIYGSNGDIVMLDVATGSSKVLINRTDIILASAIDFQLSADKLYLLVAYNYQKIFRYSYVAYYLIIDLTTGKKTALLPGGKQQAQLVIWAPVGNALAIVTENNIFYKKSVNDPEIAITNTTGYVSNGVPDWVYEEEVLSSNKALWFSPDGKKLAYGRYNDTDVPLMVLPIYGEPGSLTYQYPRASVIKYPKSGETNPTVSLHYVDLAAPTEEYELKVPVDFNEEEILSTTAWANNDILTVTWLNRVQNQGVITSYNTSNNPATTIIVKQLVVTNGWLDLFTPPIFSEDGSEMLLILSQDQGASAGGYRHIALLNTTIADSPQRAITSGKFVVTSILGWNHNNNTIYYLANTESDSAVQHLYSTSLEGDQINCLSCKVKSRYNTSMECSYNSAEFSQSMDYYSLTCAGPDVPHASVYDKNGTKILDWTENNALAAYLSKKTPPVIKKLSYDIADGFKANVQLRLPPNMDYSGDTKYPMLVNVYGGPDSYKVIDKFVLDWGSYLTANKSIIYATIDGRGSGLRGDKLMFSGYRNLGTVEIVDQINVTRLIQESLPYVDSSKTAIWGWSYGGYASGMALADDTEGVFKCGISVAPVTDWALYDSIYTERFMGLPTLMDNLEGYERAQLLKKPEGLRNKEYFLIHGTLDDNVHYQQSMMWSKVLEQNDILFRQLSYPDENHNLGSVFRHLYHSLEDFLDDCFDKKK
ncbi:unnamed protein product [Phyllotreta striolata]|uniref:Venom dipeptidyl peptidase 4 n=1 Tax=Phyllotreta striolata TaxID=444603 RepID=A0A9N9TES3_PHYSR|nr:unnamed protein product [Phyllotreta striolata]